MTTKALPPQFVLMARKEMKPKPHPRADDIERAQPPLWTPKGIGNVKQLGGFIPDVWRL